MKILFILSVFPKMSETFVLNQIKYLLDNGHHVDIFAEYRLEEERVQEVVREYALIDTCISLAPPAKRLSKFMALLAALLKSLLTRPGMVLRSFKVSNYSSIRSALSLLYMGSKVSNENYDVILCHFGPNGIMGDTLRELGAISGVLATVFHGYDLSSYVQRNGTDCYKELFSRGELFLPVSGFWRDKLLELGCSGKKTIVHRMGVDIKDFVFNEAKYSESGTVRFVSVARLVEKKGILDAVTAFSMIRSEYPDAAYYIIGDGPQRDEVRELIERVDCSDRVHLLGLMTSHEIHVILERSHVFVAPSATAVDGDKEGIPVSIMEALAMGIPVISTYHSGIPELVKDSVSGFLINEHDIAALAGKMKEVIERRHDWASMGRAGREFVARNYNAELQNERLVDIFEMALTNNLKANPQEGSVRQESKVTG